MPLVLCTTLLRLGNWVNGGSPIGKMACALKVFSVDPMMMSSWNEEDITAMEEERKVRGQEKNVELTDRACQQSKESICGSNKVGISNEYRWLPMSGMVQSVAPSESMLLRSTERVQKISWKPTGGFS